MIVKGMKILVLGGDGIGPEVTAAAERVLQTISARENVMLEFEHHLVGGACYDETGRFSTDEMMEAARLSDAILFGSEGGPKWDVLEIDCRPEERAGLSRLRLEFQLFANLRPIKFIDAIQSSSTLKAEVIRNVDFVIVRELCGGIYFGSPRGTTTRPDGMLQAIDTLSYTEAEIERIAHTAFTLARRRRRHVTSVDKANVLASSTLWRKVFSRLGAEQYADVELEHMYVDNAAMQIIRDPRQFDVLVTENLFGDILSDGAAMIAGSLGVLPSAALGDFRGDGRRFGLYEPVHGSANDIAGRGIANPLGSILSAAMLLEFSLGRADLAAKVDHAVQVALKAGVLPADLGGSASTSEVTEAVIAAL